MTRAEPQPVPPKIRTAPSLTFFAIAVSSFVVAGGLAFVYSFNPSTHGFYPTCLFHQLTGLNCPGCGATRSLYALLHGNLSIALRDNALFVLSLGAGGIFGARFLLEKWRNRLWDSASAEALHLAGLAKVLNERKSPLPLSGSQSLGCGRRQN